MSVQLTYAVSITSPVSAGQLGVSSGGAWRRNRPSDLLDLAVLQLDRCRPAENRDADLQPPLVLVDFLDRAVEAGERSVCHPHLLADFEQHRRTSALHALLVLLQYPNCLGFA